MDQLQPFDITFLNLHGLEEHERVKLLNTLRSDNAHVQLPWQVSKGKNIRTTEKNHEVAAVPNNNQMKQNPIPQNLLYFQYTSYQCPGNVYKQPARNVLLGSAFSIPQPQYVAHSAASTTCEVTVPINPPVTSNVSNLGSDTTNSWIAGSQNITGQYNNKTKIHNNHHHHSALPARINQNFDLKLNGSPAHVHNQLPANQAYVATSYQHVNNQPPANLMHAVASYQTADIKTLENQALRKFVKNVSSATQPFISPSYQNGVHSAEQNAKEDTPKNKSWASLFNSSKLSDSANESMIQSEKSGNQTVNSETDNDSNSDICPIRHPRKTSFVDPVSFRIGEFLLSHTVNGRTNSLQPRGLINRSNYCYINSILQALLACPPAYNLFSGLAKENTSFEKEKETPIIDGLCRFVKEFQHLPANLRIHRRNGKNDKKAKKDQSFIDCDLPIEPSWMYKILNGVRSDSFLVEGRQEDAEEFLGCLLNGLNDEMIDLMKLVKSDLIVNKTKEKVIDEEDSDWKVMGPKNKGGVTRQTEYVKTPISDIFGGSLKSKIHRTGDQSTYNIQPFFTLQLNITKVKTVREALEVLVTKNQLEGVTSEKTKEEVEAWQQVTLEELPVVLVLHLKCFDFKLNGCTKIIKSLEFPIDLKIDAKWLSSKPNSPKEKQYKLFAVVYHDGKEATKGHYITDAFHIGYSCWLRYDDQSVKQVQEENVLNPQGTRVPYLLFYRRSDTIRSK